MDGMKDECLNMSIYYSIMANYRFLPKIKYKPQISDIARQIPSSLKLQKKSLHINLIYILRNKQLKHKITTDISVVFSMTFFQEVQVVTKQNMSLADKEIKSEIT